MRLPMALAIAARKIGLPNGAQARAYSIGFRIEMQLLRISIYQRTGLWLR